MSKFDSLFTRNQLWAERIKEINPEFFHNRALQQKPELLWIGCADSRVPANQIIDLPPGEVFVHRNIANVLVSSDLDCLSSRGLDTDEPAPDQTGNMLIREDGSDG